MEMFSFIKAALVFAIGFSVQGYRIYSKPAHPECPDPGSKIGVCAELCHSDTDCHPGQRCCSNGCGHECIGVKPGLCPKVFNTFAPAPPCVHDQNCGGNEKCCRFHGGSVCAPPILTHPECPDPGSKIGVCAELCHSDTDCHPGQRCCSNGCGHECIGVKPGLCPKVFNTFAPAPPCVYDQNCGGNEKCCRFHGGSVCAPPILTHPECPDPGSKIGVCAELCHSDTDCHPGQRCCSNGCGHECIGIKPVIPGRCGSMWIFSWYGGPCQHDSDCLGYTICCPTFWGPFCKDPYQPNCH